MSQKSYTTRKVDTRATDATLTPAKAGESLDELLARARAKAAERAAKAATPKPDDKAAKQAARAAVQTAALSVMGDAPAKLCIAVTDQADDPQTMFDANPKIFQSGNVGYWGQSKFTAADGSRYQVQVTVVKIG
jgi:hypothetical protein